MGEVKMRSGIKKLFWGSCIPGILKSWTAKSIYAKKKKKERALSSLWREHNRNLPLFNPALQITTCLATLIFGCQYFNTKAHSSPVYLHFGRFCTLLKYGGSVPESSYAEGYTETFFIASTYNILRKGWDGRQRTPLLTTYLNENHQCFETISCW